jgi:hypothetical protein
LWYAGKTHDFGGNIQALFYPSGIPLRVSDVLPGNVHDLAGVCLFERCLISGCFGHAARLRRSMVFSS